MRYVIIGGGVAGTTVADSLPLFDNLAQITLISATDTVKKVIDLEKKGEVVSSFNISDSSPETNRYNFICGAVIRCDIDERIVTLKDGRVVPYDRMCVATGARPNIVFPGLPDVVGIRDTETVEDLQSRLKHCKHITVLGNGGIASELVFAMNNCHVSWVIKDKTISSVFVNSVASKFLLDTLGHTSSEVSNIDSSSNISKRHLYSTTVGSSINSDLQGSALGPDWYSGRLFDGACQNKLLEIEYDSEISNVENLVESDHKIQITLSNGKVIKSDILVSATGVIPNSDIFQGSLKVCEADGGILVNRRMQTSNPHVFAAGDVCTIPWRESENWKQMRLWTQALQQGFYTARCMATSVDDIIEPDIAFEIFTHSTKLFGFKIILLGRFQEWEGCQCYFRITPQTEYIKLVVFDSRIQGALLIGETDLEEVMENLILNQLDISQLGEDILDPNIDIEDYFD